ncbi:S1C family serine protease [Planctomycetota bacterium]
MDAARFKSNKRGSCCVILLLSILLMLTLPASAFAQDDNAVAILRAIGRTFAEISKKASPAIVVLTVDEPSSRVQLDLDPWWKLVPANRQMIPLPEPPGSTQANRPDLPRIRPISPRIQKPSPKARGLGIIVSNDGHILTCNHIIDGAKKINAELADGREFEAEIVGTDPETGIAVIKIDAKDLPALKLGDSDELEAGGWVVGISNTMGLGRAFTHGLVTAKGISGFGMVALEDFVQTSINLQIGDGGGPLLDLDGNVVGMNVAIMGERGKGISFAIPAGMAKDIYEQLIKTGTVERGFLGIAFKDVDAEIAEGLDLETIEGVVVQNIIKDSAAEKAGMKRYDVLTEFNGEPIESASRFIIRVATLKPGTQVELVVLRDGQRQNLTVTLGKRPSRQERKPDDIPNAP